MSFGSFVPQTNEGRAITAVLVFVGNNIRSCGLGVKLRSQKTV